MCCRVSCVELCNRAHTLQTGYLFAHTSQQRNIEAQGDESLLQPLCNISLKFLQCDYA